MKITTIKKLQEYFIGKICTILTTGVNKSMFTDIQFADFFTGFVESIDEDGIWTRHHLTGCKNFYPISFVVGIMEEQIVQEDNPNYKKLMEQVEKTAPETRPMVQPYDAKQSPFVNPEMLAAIAKRGKS